jgi:hypothetical protein
MTATTTPVQTPSPVPIGEALLSTEAAWEAAWGHTLTDRPQVFPGLPRDAYAQLPAINASLIKCVALKNEAHAWRKMRDPEREESEDKDDFLVGHIAHTVLLEPELFNQRYLEIPADAPSRPTAKQLESPKPNKDGSINDKTKAYAAWQEALQRKEWWEQFQAKNKHFLTAQLVPHKLQQLGKACGQAVLDHPVLGGFFDKRYRHLNELTLTYIDPLTGRRMKCRLDCLRVSSGLLWIGDLKTARTAAPGPDGFARDAGNHGYLLSATFYHDATIHCREPLEELLDLPDGALIGIVRRFEWIAIEKACPRPDFIGRYFLTEEQLESARPAVRAGIDRVVQAEASGWWPGYDTAAQPLELSGYASQKMQRLAGVEA